MLIQSNFRHPEIATSSFPVRFPEVPALVASARPCAPSFYRADETIYAQGDAAGPLYLVEFGTVRMCRLTADGRRQISAFHFAGEVFGFEPGAERQSYAESVDGAGIRVLRPTSDEGFGSSVLSIALRGLARAQSHLVLLGRMTATEKMASFLVDLMDRQGSDDIVNLPMQRSDIADYLGLTFETVSRILRILKDADLVRIPRIDQIEVLNLAGLQEMCE
jgi:CRP/FNR family transcriptional regulator, nitrogen fixation regulation protein